jgi:hypothetical protein
VTRAWPSSARVKQAENAALKRALLGSTAATPVEIWLLERPKGLTRRESAD